MTRLSEHKIPLAAIGAGLGALVGFGVALMLYAQLVPLLEAADGLVRELQGVLWNLVPISTVAGAAGGWWSMDRWHRHGGQ